MLNEGKEPISKQCTFDYFSNNDINSQEIYNWLLDNQYDSDSTFLLGYFNFFGIFGIEKIKSRCHVFYLFLAASKQNHTLAQYYIGNCHLFGYGVTKNEKFAFME